MDTKALRQKILDLAIHGKLVPQDPNDEPASVLLERIRAEKERLIKEGKIKKGKKSAKTSDKPHYPYELPKGWEWTTLGEVISIKSGNAIKVRNNKNGSFPIYGGNGISGYSDEYNIDKPTIVIGRVGFYCGSIHYVKSKAWVTDNAFITSIYGNVYDIDFLYYLLTYCNLRQYSNSTAQPVISGKTIYPVHVPVPPIKEQRKIVEKIEFWLSCISQLEFSQSKVKSTIKQAKSKILDLAIHGKLVQQDPNDEPASELLKRINPKAEITCDTPQYGKLPFVIPSSWEWVKLSGIAKSNIGLTYRPTDIVSTGVPVYRSNNIRNGKIDTTDLVKVSTKILEKQLLHVGDLLICARNGSRNLIGKNAIISELKEPTSFGAFMAVCRSAYNQWIRIVLNSEYFDRYLDDSNSATINQVTQKMLLALPIPLPPHQEQHRIVAKIEELFAQLDKIEASL